MLGELFVQERVVGVEDVEHRAVVCKQIGEEPNRLLVHRRAVRRTWEMSLALFVELIEVVDVQPLAGELGRQAAGLGIREHAPHLRFQHLGI